MLLNLLFPKRCLHCAKLGSYLCAECTKQIPWHAQAKCLACGKRAIDGYTHPRCLGSWGLDRCIMLSHYRGPTRSLVRGLKYRGVSDEAVFLAQLMSEKLEHQQLKDFEVTSVPLHFSRSFGRGFNQSDLLGSKLAKCLVLPYQELLFRGKATPSQVGLGKAERAGNIRGAFGLLNKEDVRGKKFLLVDDVITTGATVKECAKILKRSGAKQVWAVALAHG